MASDGRKGMTNAEVAQANPQGVVNVRRGANGVMEFSGGNVTGDVSYADGQGNAIAGGGPRGRGFSNFDVAPAGSNVAMSPNGYAFATSGSGMNGQFSAPRGFSSGGSASGAYSVVPEEKIDALIRGGATPDQLMQYTRDVERAQSQANINRVAADYRKEQDAQRAARNASMGSSSNLDYNRMSRSEIQARTSLAGIEAQKQTAQMQNQTTLRGQDINAETSRYGADASTDASRYGSDNSLRGQMYSSDAQLGAKRMEMQRGLRQQQAMGELWKASGGDPAKFQSLAMQYGLPDAAKQGGDMVAARQTQAKANSEDAQSTFKGMFLDKEGKPDAGGEAMAHHAASQIVPGWENMSQEQRNAERPRVVEYVNMLQQANNNRDTGWLQKAGITKSSDMRSQMPDMTGATLSDVDWWEGATTPNIGRGDKKVTLKSGAEMHFDSLNEAQKRLLEINGVRPQK